MGQSNAFKAIQRHISGFGVYGAFPLIVPLHGGGGELSQAFCRMAAVNGTTYILNRRIRKVEKTANEEYPFQVAFEVKEGEPLGNVVCKNIVRLAKGKEVLNEEMVCVTKRICIVHGGGDSGVFDPLFGSEAQFKDAALVIVPPHSVATDQDMPIQIVLHGGGIGECPVGQWVIYSSIRGSGQSALDNLLLAEDKLLEKLSTEEHNKGIGSPQPFLII